MTERLANVHTRPDGRRVYFELGGPADGLPLVLLRGLGRSLSYWLEFRDRLEEAHRVLALDNAGVGRSDDPPLRWSAARMADDAAGVMDDAGLARADVLGLSLGGMVAQHLALRHPARARRLVLLATTAGGALRRRPRRRVALRAVRASVLKRGVEGQAELARVLLSPSFLAARPDVPATWAAIGEREKKSLWGLAAQSRAALAHDVVDDLHRIEQRALVVHGTADALVPPSNGDLLASCLPRARWVSLDGVGHEVPCERPTALAGLVRDFLAES